MPVDDYPEVTVRAEVNVEAMRRGREYRLRLTPRAQRMVDSGHLAIVGHVGRTRPVAPPAAVPVPDLPDAEPPAEPEPVAPPRKRVPRSKKASVAPTQAEGEADGDPGASGVLPGRNAD